jgi:hypothetical protein
MAHRIGLSTYLPDRPPTWSEVGLAGLVLGNFGLSLQFGLPWWPAVLIGFISFAFALGPGANTAVGNRVGHWFRQIGNARRATVILLFVLVIATVSQLAPQLMLLLADVGYGGLAACVAFTILHVLVAGEISGWRPNRSSVDEQ